MVGPMANEAIFEKMKQRLNYLKALFKENPLLRQMMAVLVLAILIIAADLLLIPSLSIDRLARDASITPMGLLIGFLIGDLIRKIPLRIRRPPAGPMENEGQSNSGHTID